MQNQIKKASSYKASDLMRRIFFTAFAVLFSLLFLQVLFANPHFEYDIPVLLLFVTFWCALFAGLYFLTNRSRLAPLLEKREKIFLAAFFILQILTQIFFHLQTGGYPSFDLEKVFYGSLNFTVNGFIEEPFLDYFYKYPHNMPLVILLQFVFRAFYRLGIPMEQFFLLGVIIGAASMLLTYLFVYLCARRLFGVRQAFFAIMLLYLCIPLQSYVSVFYTDTLTLPFAPLALYCYLRVRDAKTRKERFFAAAAMSAGLAFGVTLKYSVVIVLIALLTDMLLNRKWRQLLASIGVFLAVFAVLTWQFNRYMYAHFLDEEIAADKATPFTSWIMMSLAGDGSHNAYDNDRVWYYETAEEKRQEARQQIQERLAARSLGEHLVFYNQKGLRSFGSGNLDAVRWVVDVPIRDTALSRLMTPNQHGFKVFDTLMQGYYVSLFALLVIGAALSAKQKDYTVFVPCLVTFGLYLFLLLWEASQRYLLNFYGMYILAAVFAAGKLAALLKTKETRSTEKISLSEGQNEAAH